MTAPSPEEVTRLLIEWKKGNQEALVKLMPVVYEELRGLAHHYMRRERPGQTANHRPGQRGIHAAG
jgi:hypothetical protein